MGTSKGYIPPTTPHWTQAKRAVTALLNSENFDSRAKAASKFATAVKTDISSRNTITVASVALLGFAQKIRSVGLEETLRDYDRLDLLDKSSEVIWAELLHTFTNAGATAEEHLVADALSQAIDNLEIENISELGDISAELLLKEILKEYIKAYFAFCYEEKISKGRSPAEVVEILNGMNEYIDNSLDNDLDLSRINTVDFTDLNADTVVENALVDALNVFEKYYGEADS